MNRLDVTDVKQLIVSDDARHGAVIVGVANGAEIAIHLSLEAFTALEVMLATAALQQSRSTRVH